MNLCMAHNGNHSRNKVSMMLDVSNHYKGVVRESLLETHNRACVNVRKKRGILFHPCSEKTTSDEYNVQFR